MAFVICNCTAEALEICHCIDITFKAIERAFKCQLLDGRFYRNYSLLACVRYGMDNLVVGTYLKLCNERTQYSYEGENSFITQSVPYNDGGSSMYYSFSRKIHSHHIIKKHCIQ